MSDGLEPIDSVQITINGIVKNTNSSGMAIFDSVAAGTQIAYAISKIGYEVTDGRQTLTDTMTCTGNTVIRVSLRKQAVTSCGTEKPAGIKIYPNPSDGLITISNYEGAKITIYNTDGKLVKITKVIGSAIDLRPITPGLYTLVAETPDGNMSAVIVIR